MFKMYALTVFFAVAVWAAITAYFAKGPIADHATAIFFYGGMVPLTMYSFWWNIVRFKKVTMPPFLEAIRIPLAAIALGINSAYYGIKFVNPDTQKMIHSQAITNLWLGFEIVLTISLIVGIYRWAGRRNSAELQAE